MCCSVNGSVCLVCCVFEFLVNQFAICLGVVIILSLNVVEVMCEEVLCWIDRVWFSKECACCACDTSVHLCAPYIGFVYVCACRKFKSLRAGSQLLCILPISCDLLSSLISKFNKTTSVLDPFPIKL